MAKRDEIPTTDSKQVKQPIERVKQTNLEGPCNGSPEILTSPAPHQK
ncbi:MAG TPA: hypothetical protein VFY83_15065 [Anaerolineales bacterium]|nr:hypothetical protein [Anaerolineales bacterium]